VRRTLLANVKEWNIDPRWAAKKPLQDINEVKKRLAEAAPIDRNSGRRPWPASSTNDSSDSETGQRWRSSCRKSTTKDMTSSRSHEP
jgi:hypothetical protein